MTHFLEDILRQPVELQRAIDYLQGASRRRLAEAAATIRNARHVYLTGIGSSWHAALTAAPLFSLGGHPVPRVWRHRHRCDKFGRWPHC